MLLTRADRHGITVDASEKVLFGPPLQLHNQQEEPAEPYALSFLSLALFIYVLLWTLLLFVRV